MNEKLGQDLEVERVLMQCLDRGEVLLGFLLIIERIGWDVSVEVVVAEVERPEVGKVREGGRDLPSEVILLKVESGEGGKCSELSRERAFEAITVEVKEGEGGESANLR